MIFPDEAEVARISAIPDAASRNMLITKAYAHLSAEAHRRLPGAANWCTFATWASRQAGVTIRHEDLAEALRMRLRASEVFRGLAAKILAAIERSQVDLVDLVVKAIADLGPLRRSGESVANGNRKVFEEIGMQFSRFLTRFPDFGAITDREMDEFCAALAEGDAPRGQGLLRDAFRGYRAAARSRGVERAQFVLLANLRIGFHEQTRLQQDIQAALDGALLEPGDLTAFLMGVLGKRQRWNARMLRRLLPCYRTPLEKLATRVAFEVRTVVRMVITDHLMTLRLAGDDLLRLGQDLSRPFPADLRSLSDSNLVKLLEDIDPTPDSEAASGALDWADLRERMHFICDLFRAYQEDERLLAPPFGEDAPAG